ncbi:hypothetical protein CVIRNUC_009661 [Coccomyxa viridis]|uniref:Uncharacterized protein n=1 Tax=Coccomyxa viridis TaxID=1274662 RepID=A0AAV1IKK6_9CHLO|nr:hypothetical protein CVIRNUC_009661 [Coccomyxa viridis]
MSSRRTIPTTRGLAAMSHITLPHGLMSARHGVFQAPGMRRQSRSVHLQIRLERSNNLLSAEQTSRAMERQLQRAKDGVNGNASAANAQDPPEQTNDSDLSARQQEARDWISAWREGSAPESASSPEAQAESQKVLAEVRASNPLLTKEQERAAMERLLNKGTRSVEEDADADVKGTSATDADSSTSSQPDSEGGKYAPKETFEDGSVMYAASDLEAVAYEAVLAP